MVKIKRIEKLEDIGRDAWSQALRSSGQSYIFQTYEFIHSWWGCFGRGNSGRQLLVLAVEDAGFITAIAPLMITRSPFLNRPVIQFIGDDICDYMDFIIGHRNYDAYLLKISEYLSNLGFLEIGLRYIPEGSRVLNKPITEHRRICRIDYCPYVVLKSGWQEIEGGLKNKLKREVYNSEKKMRQKGDLIFKSHLEGPPSRGALDAYFELHIKRWKHYGNKYSQFQYARWRDFVSTLSSALAQRGWLDFSCLEFDKKLIACHFGFRYNNKLYYYMPAFDPEFAAYSPSKVLIMKMLERSAREGLEEFDFLRGQEPYKMAWTQSRRPLYSIYYYSARKSLRYPGLIYRAAKDCYAKHIKAGLKKIRPLINLWYRSRGDS
ncbi:MAG: GNAT family N-acetyltransferase [Candidatus Omnitrophica bacterium]|nr:GNAT family N-acetyltransferase [Candidatus Omnitrophota bacterium]